MVPGSMRVACFLAAVLASTLTATPSNTAGESVLVVVNEKSSLSRRIGDYYVKKREIPLEQVCKLNVTADEEISRETFEASIEKPIAAFLKRHSLTERVLYLVTTAGVPLKIVGEGAELQSTAASVDSELAGLYARAHGVPMRLPGPLNNPYFLKADQPFQHPDFPIYLVTRLAGYSYEAAQGLVDRSLAAKNEGMFVFDARADNNTPGNTWLRAAAQSLPPTRVLLEDTAKVIYNQKRVIGYASWGSNDPDRHRRDLGFEWLPGAISTEYVSTNARTFAKPPDSWNLGTWKDPSTWFAGSPQTMTADLVQDGVTGASGHVYEPFLELNPRPDYLFPAYYHGRNLAESYYGSLPAISWMNVVIGDPLCQLR